MNKVLFYTYLMFLIMGVSAPAFSGEAANEAEIVISGDNYTPGIDWQNGSLSYEIFDPVGRPQRVTIIFRSQRDGKLASFILETSNGRIDLSEHVRTISFPVPARTNVFFTSPIPGVRGAAVIVNLPHHASAQTPGQHWEARECLDLGIVVEGRSVKEVVDVGTIAAKCLQ